MFTSLKDNDLYILDKLCYSTEQNKKQLLNKLTEKTLNKLITYCQNIMEYKIKGDNKKS